MNDQWIPGPPSKPPQWIVNPLPPANAWDQTEGCAAESGPAIVEGITITGVPATVSSLYWQVCLNDGGAPPNFEINHLDGKGAVLGPALQISGADLSATFAGPVYLARDPVEPMEAVTLEYLEAHATGIQEPPDNQTYGRALGAWNLVVPASGGTFTGQTNLAAGGAVTSGALLFAGNAVCSVPTVAQLQIGDGPAGQVPTADGNGNLTWTTPTTGGPYLPLAGGTVTGSLTVNQVLTVQGANSMVLNAPNGQQRAILGQTSTLTRWQLMLGDGTSEGLNNTGSNFSLTAYATAGGFLGNWLTIARADGSTTFNGSGVTIAGGLAVNGLLALASPNNLAIYGGSPGQVLSTNGSGILSWATPLAEAPSDGQYYARHNAAWAVAPGGMTDAPNDGTAYARKSLGWAHLTHTDITDWTATLAPYALTANVPVASTTAPLMNGTAAAGSAIVWSRGDHVHPTDTTRAAVTALPPASTVAPLASGVAAVGTSMAYARADHVHPTTAMGDNRIINGDMRIDQRNNGASGTAIQIYTIDRWQITASLIRGTWGRNLNAIAGPIGFPYYLGFQPSSAYVPLAADYFAFYQAVEADMVSDFAFGTANAQPVTLSFWARSSLTGTFGGSFQNYAATRSYPFTYSIPTANTWTKLAFTIPGDTTGTWVMSGNGGSIGVYFDLGSGSTYRAPANAWAAGNFVGANGAVNVVATNGATFYVTGVKLEVGSVATPYNRQSLAKSMADCQRYHINFGALSAYFSNSTAGVAGGSSPITYPATMRATPTINLGAPTYTNASGLVVAQSTPTAFSVYAVNTAVGGSSWTTIITCDAEL